MTDLREHLARRIRTSGPLTVADYMAEALGHPEQGYYRRGDPLGAAGDFITAPEISQMFGEILGLWCVELWQRLGQPRPFRLVELGPGRGTLMADALRAARVRPGFLAAAALHLVETSPALRRLQAEALRRAAPGIEPHWHETVAELPAGPLLLLANEFFDALPVHQFERTAAGWRERLVALGEAGGFRFALGPPGPALALLPPALRAAPAGAVAEVSPAALAIAGEIGRRLAAAGGAALILDYGPSASAPGDSLQAVRRHRPQDPLAAPGRADLTAHVDFAALAGAAAAAGARAWGPLPQGLLLARLGLPLRAAMLARGASAEQAAAIRAAAARLLDADAMGMLFKALALAAPGLPPPPGFEPAEECRIARETPRC